ncbi:MAG: heavy metal translocating P-type ATPase metal-binding domain-containing protein [Polyangiales bacterium]
MTTTADGAERLALSPSTSAAVEACAHCGQPIPSGREDGYCCRGCKTVHSLLETSGLSRYYDLRSGPGIPVAEAAVVQHDRKWLEPILAEQAASEAGCRVRLDLQGVHCAACVWLVETVFEREKKGGSIEVNPALGRAELVVTKDFPLTDFVEKVEQFGYRVGPAGAEQRPASDGLLLRAGICLALAANAMMLSAAIHLGLREGLLYRWAAGISYGAAVLAMAIGAPIFVRGAWLGLRRRILHLDLPIAIGMGLAFVGSSWSYFVEAGANYVDTLTIFVALMLLGRWLQTRVLERNRRELLADHGAESLLTRRVSQGKVELIPCTHIEAEDVLLVAPGDLVPVASNLEDVEGLCSFDWIDGESTPRALKRGDDVPSGAFNTGRSAIRVRAKETFQASEVWSLLRGTGEVESTDRTIAGVPKNIGGIYVVGVLVASALAFVFTLLRGGSPSLAMEITTATLVVTCPCAFGIAVPLAYEVVQSELRRRGIFVRRPSLFERALGIRTVVFDKTGTLTTGRLRLVDASPIDALSADDRRRLYDLAARSNHPKSRAIQLALEDAGRVRLSADAAVVEIAGKGLELREGDSVYRLGSQRFAAPGRDELAASDLVFSRDESPVAVLSTEEESRPEAADEIRRIARHHDVFVLSGDEQGRCEKLAGSLALDAQRVVGGQSPDDKARWLEERDAASILMVGDGLNDAKALSIAGASATPSVDRPFTAARCDFYFVTPGLEPVSEVLGASKRLASVVRDDLVIAVVYNLLAIVLCWAGLMRPWLAALLMPASSLATIAFTLIALSKRRRRWTF